MSRELAYLRADVSKSIGLGHLSRAVAMSHALAREGIRPMIFCRRFDSDGRSNAKLEKHRDVIRIIKTEDEFISALERKEAKYLFVDLLEGPSYAGLVPELARLFPSYRTICFDAFFDRELPFDAHIGPGFDGPPFDANSLCGLKYFVFSQDLAELAPKKAAWQDLRRVLITLGGTDPFSVTPSIARAMCGEFPELRFTAVIGPGFAASERDELVALAKGLGNLECAVEPESLGPLYLAADFAITSAGQTKFETSLFGIPSFLLANTSQEEELAGKFAVYGSSAFLGRSDRLDMIGLKQKFSELASQPQRLREMSRKGRSMLDIRGGERVIEHIKRNLP